MNTINLFGILDFSTRQNALPTGSGWLELRQFEEIARYLKFIIWCLSARPISHSDGSDIMKDFINEYFTNMVEKISFSA
jgi:hypothetical protein